MGYARILIDISAMYHRAYNVTRDLSFKLPSGEEVATGGIYETLRIIKKLDREYLNPGGAFYFLFDNASSVEVRRQDIDPDYKINRFKQNPIFYKGLDFLSLILQSWQKGHFVFQNPGSEADDLVGVLLDGFPAVGRTLLVSTDLDWARGMGSKVDWLTRKKKEDHLLDLASFREEYGFTPGRQSIGIYKSIHGDVNDNIPNAVPNLPKEDLLRLCEEPWPLRELIRRVELGEIDYVSPHFREKMLAAKGRILLNYQLVDYLAPPRQDIEDNLVETDFRPNTLKSLYKTLGFNIEKLDDRPELKDKAPVTGFVFDFLDYERA